MKKLQKKSAATGKLSVRVVKKLASAIQTKFASLLILREGACNYFFTKKRELFMISEIFERKIPVLQVVRYEGVAFL